MYWEDLQEEVRTLLLINKDNNNRSYRLNLAASTSHVVLLQEKGEVQNPCTPVTQLVCSHPSRARESTFVKCSLNITS